MVTVERDIIIYKTL